MSYEPPENPYSPYDQQQGDTAPLYRPQEYGQSSYPPYEPPQEYGQPSYPQYEPPRRRGQQIIEWFKRLVGATPQQPSEDIWNPQETSNLYGQPSYPPYGSPQPYGQPPDQPTPYEPYGQPLDQPTPYDSYSQPPDQPAPYGSYGQPEESGWGQQLASGWLYPNQLPEYSTYRAPMNQRPAPAIKIFYCYSHKDKELREELEHHFSSLRRLGKIKTWCDREIQPGAKWEKEIDTSLESANLVLLLVSSDFIDSDYCWGKEMKRALERDNEGTARVIPIILRPVHWQGTPIAELQLLPTGGKPVTEWSVRDRAFTNIVEEINKVITDLQSQLMEDE